MATQAVVACSRTRPQNKKAITIYFGTLTSVQHYQFRLRPPVAQKHMQHARRVSRHRQEPSWHDPFLFPFPPDRHNERVMFGKMLASFGVVQRVGKSLLSSTHCRGRKGASLSKHE